MNPTIQYYEGAPLEVPSEREFLARVTQDLCASRTDALIFGNFHPVGPAGSRQIDFFFVTAATACHVELKTISRPIVGAINGPWQIILQDGSRKTLGPENPYSQALSGKIAISDSMHHFARLTGAVPTPELGQRYYKSFSSVVCVFPELASQSRCYSDYKVSVIGYPELLARLTGDAKPQLWNMEHWKSFASFSSLAPADCAIASSAPGKRELRHLVQEFNILSLANLRTQLGHLHPIPIESSTGRVTVDALMKPQTVPQALALVGASGTGKTHSLRHLLASAISEGSIAVLASCRSLSDDVWSLMSASIRRFSQLSLEDLLEYSTATGCRLFVGIDELNAAPLRCRADIFRAAQSLLSHSNVSVILTTHETCDIDPSLGFSTLRFTALEGEDKLRLFESFGNLTTSTGVEQLLSMLSTPFEIALAAQTRLTSRAGQGRSNYIDAYISHCCSHLRNAPLMRRLIRSLVFDLVQRDSYSAGLADLLRSAEITLSTWNQPQDLCLEVVQCPLFVINAERIQVAHEELEVFLSAEQLAVSIDRVEDACRQLNTPRFRVCLRDFLSLHPHTDFSVSVLRQVGTSTEWTLGLDGELGPDIQSACLAEVSAALESARAAVGDLTLAPMDADSQSRIRITVTNSQVVATLLIAAMASTQRYRFLERLLAGVAECDRTLIERMKGYNTGATTKKISLSDLIWSAYIAPPALGGSQVPYAAPLRQAHASFDFTATAHELSLLLQTLDSPELTPGQALLCLSLLKGAHSLPEGTARILFSTIKKAKAAHVLFEALDAALYARRALTVKDQEIMKDSLATLEGYRNPFANTALFEALDAYDLIEPTLDSDACAATARELGSVAISEHSSAGAYGWVSALFEGPNCTEYWTALDLLTTKEKRSLFLAAASYKSDGFHTPWILSKLLDLLDDSCSSILMSLATVVRVERTSFLSDAVETFVLSHIALARLGPEFPSTLHSDLTTDDQCAWAFWGKVLWQIERNRICSIVVSDFSERAIRAALDQFPLSSFSALAAIWQWGGGYEGKLRDTLSVLARQAPEATREFLHHAVRNLARLTSILRWPSRRDWFLFALALLTPVGNDDTRALLAGYTDDPELGRDAIEAIRVLQRRR